MYKIFDSGSADWPSKYDYELPCHMDAILFLILPVHDLRCHGREKHVPLIHCLHSYYFYRKK